MSMKVKSKLLGLGSESKEEEQRTVPAATRKAKLKVEKASATVIDEQLIRSAIAELPPGSDESVKQLMDLREVNYIAKIENLVGFYHLTKLQLDNNTITRIENLSHLTTLEWMDLSFNNIGRIEGLETLTRLTDLSLFNNQITEVRGLEALTNLQCLSLGNNMIISYEETVKYLRRFKKLRLLNLQGNPLFESKRDKKRAGAETDKREKERLQLSEAELGEYRNYVIAYMKQLRYLDYKLITEEERQAARSLNETDVMALEEEERKEEKAAAEAARKAASHARLSGANIAGIEELLDNCVTEDAELAKLQPLAALLTPLQEAQARYKEIVADFVANMLQRHEQREEEKRLFWQAVDDVRNTHEDSAKNAIAEYETLKKRVSRALEGKDVTPENEQAVHELVDAVEALSDSLLEIEITQVEQTEELVREFNHVTDELKSLNLQKVTDFFGQNVRPMLQDVKSNLAVMFEKEQEKYNAASTEDALATWSEDQQRLLDDKETLGKILAESEENRNKQIDQMEQEISTAESRKTEAYLTKIREDERERNRLRVQEIFAYIDRQKKDNQQEFKDYFDDSDLDDDEDDMDD